MKQGLLKFPTRPQSHFEQLIRLKVHTYSMQIPAEWVAAALSVIGMIGSLIAVFLTKIAAKRERENIAEQVRLYRETKTHERYLDSLIECHRLLLEGFRVCALATYPHPRSAVSELVREAEGVVVSLTRYSWMCRDLGESIRNKAIQLRKVFSTKDYSKAAPKTGLEISEIIDTIAERIKEEM